MISEKTEILQAMAASPAWKSLSETIRWKPFQDPTEDNQTWREILGPTVIVSEHQPHFADFTYVLSQMEGFDRDRLRRHYLAALVHDLGEAEVPSESGIQTVGDIPKNNRLKSADESDREILIAFYFLGRLNLNPSLLGELIIAYREVVAGDNEAEFTFFDAIQRLEYIDTIIHAYSQHKKGSSIVHVSSMVARVLRHDFPKVLLSAATYPKSVGAYLGANRLELDEMFDFAFKSYPNLPAQFVFPFSDLTNASSQWESWKSQHPKT